MTWLITIARNRAVDRLRSPDKFAGLPVERADSIPDDRPSPFETIEISDEERHLAICLEQLGNVDAGFIRTAFFEGATYSDLAARSAIPLGTLKSRIRRALLSLRTCLEGYDCHSD